MKVKKECPECGKKYESYKQFKDGSKCWTHNVTKVVEWKLRTLRLPIVSLCYDNPPMKEE
jgi:hypothetical protein